jgi:hypothetical protein
MGPRFHFHYRATKFSFVFGNLRFPDENQLISLTQAARPHLRRSFSVFMFMTQSATLSSERMQLQLSIR